MRLAIVLGAVIYTERTARGLGQKDLAVIASMHPMAISKIERGIQHDIGVETLQRIGAALGIKASELLTHAEHWQKQLPADVGDMFGASLAAFVLKRLTS